MHHRLVGIALALASVNVSTAVAQESEPIREMVIGIDPEVPLTLIGPVSILRDSSLVVGQPLERHLKVFDWNSEHETNVGRGGGGPGEFRFVNEVGSVAGREFWVWDGGHRRLSVFEADGVLRETISAERIGLSRILLYLPPDTLVVLRRSPRMQGEIVSVAAGSGESGRTWFQYDIVSRPSLRYDLPGFGQKGTGSNPFRDAPIVRGAADGSGVVHVSRPIANSESQQEFTIRVLRTDGTAVTRSVIYQPVRVDEDDIERAVADVASLPRSVPGTPQSRIPEASLNAEIRKAMWVPSWHTPVTEAILASDGRVWLRRENAGPVVMWEVYSPDLVRVEAVFHLPSIAEIRAVDRGRFWVVELGQNDEPLVSRYRVPGLS